MTGPEFDANGRVIGVTLKSGEKVYGDAVIAADGAYSPIKRALKIDSEYNGYSAIAIRSEMHANRPDSDQPRHLPEACSSRAISCPATAGCSRWATACSTSGSATSTATRTGSRSTPPSSSASSCDAAREWELPPIEELKKNKSVRAWRLPMGFTAWPPWRPGVLFTGDSLGAGKPASGAGISKALESGSGRGRMRDRGAAERRPRRLHQLRAADGGGVGQGSTARPLLPQAGGHPGVANTGIKLIDNAFFRDRMLKALYKKAQGPQHTYK